MKLKSVRIQRFKRVGDASFDVKGMNVLVGSNNSGKSTIVQALHFGVALLHTLEATGIKWPKAGEWTSINPGDIIYSPSEDVYALGAGAKLNSNKDQGPKIDYTLESGETCSIALIKGKNRNIAVAIENVPVARQLSKLDHPFSVFSPGLAGISKREAYVSDGVLFRALARGDANLVLRNILLRLWPEDHVSGPKTDVWEGFLAELREIFPKIDIRVEFDQALDEHIKVSITSNGADWVPLEIAGTGVLQATQILSYIHRFKPSLMVLDEPDSHLHPDNQRLLCGLLRKVSSTGEVQVILTTHSRHVIDSIAATSNVLCVRGGSADSMSEDDEIGVLMEIGALDAREKIGQKSNTAVVLTEDSEISFLESLIKSSGFDMPHTVVQPYHGVTSIHNLRPLVAMVRKNNPSLVVVVHRDRDYLSDDEVAYWKAEMKKLHVEPFVTDGVDVESHFLNPAYLASQNPSVSKAAFETMITECLQNLHKTLVADYVNGKVNLARMKKTSGQLNHGELAVEAEDAVSKSPRAFQGKGTLKALRARFKSSQGISLKVGSESEFLQCDDLIQIVKKVKKPPKTK
jgi:energy-coupling factor transporter ATP-binding protein EcfA2